MTTAARPLPFPDADSQPFWDACRAHEFRAQRCLQCGRFRWPPRGVCPICHSWDFEWRALTGRGTVAAYVIIRATAHPAFKDKTPYVVAHITLDDTDGTVTVTSNVVDCPPESVRVGMRVTVQFDDVSPEIALPVFRPIDPLS